MWCWWFTQGNEVEVVAHSTIEKKTASNAKNIVFTRQTWYNILINQTQNLVSLYACVYQIILVYSNAKMLYVHMFGSMWVEGQEVEKSSEGKIPDL